MDQSNTIIEDPESIKEPTTVGLNEEQTSLDNSQKENKSEENEIISEPIHESESVEVPTEVDNKNETLPEQTEQSNINSEVPVIEEEVQKDSKNESTEQPSDKTAESVVEDQTVESSTVSLNTSFAVNPDEKMKLNYSIDDVKADIPNLDPDWEHWNPNDLAVKCIFCEFCTSDLSAFWEHCEVVHNFKKEELHNDKHVSQKQWIHLVNYLRSLPESDRLNTFNTMFENTSSWDNYRNSTTFLKEDPLLYLFSDNIFEEEFDFGDDEQPVFDN